MPSDLSYWIISAPLKDGDPSLMLEDVRQRLPGVVVGGWEIPELKVSWGGSGAGDILGDSEGREGRWRERGRCDSW